MYVKRGYHLNHDNIFKLIEKHFPYYEAMLFSFLKSPNCLRIEFRNLISNPIYFLREVSDFYGLQEISDEKLKSIVEICSIQKTKSRETVGNPLNIDSRTLKGSFINNGDVRILKDSHKQFIGKLLKESKISYLF